MIYSTPTSTWNAVRGSKTRLRNLPMSDSFGERIDKEALRKKSLFDFSQHEDQD